MNYNKTTNKKDVRRYDLDAGKFWSNVDAGERGECWTWKRATNNRGYGLYRVRTLPEDYEVSGRQSTQLTAHRVAYHLHNGNLKPHNYVLHTCDNTTCCNPNHLWLGSQQDNVNDMIAKGRACWQK